MGVKTNADSGNRLTVLYVGETNGFVRNAALTYKASSAAGNCCGQMNAADFEKWVVEKLIPSLPSQTVIVLDISPYHCLQTDKPLSAYVIKVGMISWLFKNGVNSNEAMRKK
jgi:hypothetical protein